MAQNVQDSPDHLTGRGARRRARLTAIKIMLFGHASGLSTAQIAAQLNVHRTTAWRDLCAVGACHDPRTGLWTLVPTPTDVALANATLKAWARLGGLQVGAPA